MLAKCYAIGRTDNDYAIFKQIGVKLICSWEQLSQGHEHDAIQNH